MKKAGNNNLRNGDLKDEIHQSLHSQFKGKDPFLTPPDYFENLPDRIYQRIQSENTDQPVRKRNSVIIKAIGWTTGIAAAIAACFLVISILQINDKSRRNKNDEIAETRIMQQAVDEYILDNSDEETLLNYLSNDPEFDPSSTISGIVITDDSIPSIKNKDRKIEETRLLDELLNDTTLTNEDILLYLEEENYNPDN